MSDIRPFPTRLPAPDDEHPDEIVFADELESLDEAEDIEEAEDVQEELDEAADRLEHGEDNMASIDA